LVYNTLDKGGLKLTNLRAFNHALKAAWIPRLYLNTKSFCGRYYNSLLSDVGGSLVYFANLPVRDHDIFDSFYSRFFKEILSAWLQYNFCMCNEETVHQEIIWNNYYIRIDNTPILWKQFIKHGIVFINDLLDEDCKLFTFNEFVTHYGNICTYFEFHQLMSAIPVCWKSFISNLKRPRVRVCKPNMRNVNWLSGAKINNSIYNVFLQKHISVDVPQHVEFYWHDILDLIIPWKTVYSLPHNITLDPKLRQFQYKLIMKFLPSNRLLYKWGLITSPICTFCDEVDEDYFHLFWDCRYVFLFWKSVSNWFLTITHDRLLLNAANCILGDFFNTNPLHNFVLLIGRFYIFRCKQAGIVPNLNGFKAYMKLTYNIEKHIATIENKQDIHVRKWGAFVIFLDCYTLSVCVM
jgi:hypothetical protein